MISEGCTLILTAYDRVTAMSAVRLVEEVIREGWPHCVSHHLRGLQCEDFFYRSQADRDLWERDGVHPEYADGMIRLLWDGRSHSFEMLVENYDLPMPQDILQALEDVGLFPDL